MTDVHIVALEASMLDDAARLHAREFGSTVEAQRLNLAHRLFADYPAKNGAIGLAAVDRDRVVGVQMWAPWPYEGDGTTVRALQSGATLVDPAYRGRHLFQRLLAEGTRIAREAGAHCFTGFPVDASRPGLIRDGWQEIGRLRWWGSPVRPLLMLRRGVQPGAVGESFAGPDLAHYAPLRGRLVPAPDPDFLAWRYTKPAPAGYRLHLHKEGRRWVACVVKPTAVHNFPELLVGEVRASHPSSSLVSRALWGLRRAARSSGDVALLAAALLGPDPYLRAGFHRAGWFPHRSTAPFLVKPLCLSDAASARNWRGVNLEDIDTW